MVEPIKILLVQLYANGDCLYATSVAKQIKKDFPDCHLTWAVSPSSKSMLLNNKDIDNIWEVNSVPKDNNKAFRKFKKDIYKGVHGHYDKIFITHMLDTNLAHYDGCVRSAIFHGYPNKIDVPVTPVLNLLESEKQKVLEFAEKNQLNTFENVILFEFAPQSGQAMISINQAIDIALKISELGNIAVILSSAKKIDINNRKIIDGSELSIRETAHLTHFCSLLLGTSSGITWLSTSSAAKQLPMVQMLNPNADFFNPVSRDFARFGLNNDNVIELLNFHEDLLIKCVSKALVDFSEAKKLFNQTPELNFRTTRKIVYNLICYLHFSSISKHIKLNKRQFGFRLALYKEVLLGIAITPFKLIANLFKKKILKGFSLLSIQNPAS